MSFPIYSPQGDGNRTEKTTTVGASRGLFLSIPRKGTETLFQSRTTGTSSSTSPCLFLSIPRKGTETLIEDREEDWLPTVFSYLFPARGRKHHRHLLLILRSDCLFLSIPRKGTETPWIYIGYHLYSLLSFPIYSPQGDGNRKLCFPTLQVAIVFSYLFPARGRKLYAKLSSIPSHPSGLFLSIPRKGTETDIAHR